MAKLLIIKAETVKASLQYLGDVVGVYPDSHIFSDYELSIFNTLVIKGSADDVNMRLEQLYPVVSGAMKWSSDNLYHFDNVDVPEGVDVIDSIEVYQAGKRWYNMVSDFKFPANVDELTAEEKQLLETIDINNPSVDAYIKKTIKDLTTQPGNGVEIIELRNMNP